LLNWCRNHGSWYLTYYTCTRTLCLLCITQWCPSEYGTVVPPVCRMWHWYFWNCFACFTFVALVCLTRQLLFPPTTSVSWSHVSEVSLSPCATSRVSRLMQLLYVLSYDNVLLSLHLLVSGCAIYVRRYNLQSSVTNVGYMLSVTASDSGMLFCSVCTHLFGGNSFLCYFCAATSALSRRTLVRGIKLVLVMAGCWFWCVYISVLKEFLLMLFQ
jgi:hypothetical protein